MPTRKELLARATTNCCPTCGGPLKDFPLTVDLNANVLLCGDTAIKVSPRLAELIWLLCHHHPRTVSRERMFTKLWPSGDVEEKTLDTVICYARRCVEKLGYGIKAEYKVGARLVKL